MTITDTHTERRVTRIITTQTNTPYKYEGYYQKGWAIKVHFITEDGTGPYVITQTFRLKRDAVAYQQEHINGTTPTWEMTVTTDESGNAVLWSECFGMRFKG